MGTVGEPTTEPNEVIMAEELIGTVTHYFAKPEVGVVKLNADLKVGDTIRFRGHTTDFEQEVTSMQVEHQPVETAEAGMEVAVKVVERVRRGDEVFRVTAD
jgi:translation elongation factor EF-1alpha